MHIWISGSRALGSVLSALLLTAFVAPLALAVTPKEEERRSYVAQVEPICKTNTKANDRILSGVRKEVTKGKLGLASAKFRRAATAFGTATTQIAAVPQPPEDAAKLSTWIGHLRDEKTILAEIATALKKGNKHKVQSLSVKLTSNSNLANNTVLGFGFNYCVIKPSRFS
jgi:hypothetical protein